MTTYTEDQMTPWFDGKPPAPGVWKVKRSYSGKPWAEGYSYFDGTHYNGAWRDIDDAHLNRDFYSAAGHQGLLEGARVKYRGLNFDPSAGGNQS